MVENSESWFNSDLAAKIGSWMVYFLLVAFLLANFVWLIVPGGLEKSSESLWSVSSWCFQTAIGISVILFFYHTQKQMNP